MDEIVSLVVANGIFAVLFCGLLVFELRDSRSREGRYVSIIRTLNERLKTVDDIKDDTEKILAAVHIDADVKAERRAARTKPQKKQDGGRACVDAVAV